MTFIPLYILSIIVHRSDARLTGRSVVLPEAVIPDISAVRPYSDSEISQYFPSPVPIKVTGIQHPYFRPAEQLPKVDVSEPSTR
jgi:hypothetical protein